MLTHYTSKRQLKLIFISLILIFFSFSSYAKSTQILVSIKPLHSIVLHITAGVNEPMLLLSGQQSPHHFQLRPSQKRLLNQADVFFYSSDNIETFVPALKNTTPLTFIELSKIDNINSLPVRSFDSHQHHAHGNIDGHIWLSIENTKTIAKFITHTLSKYSPENTKRYNENLKLLLIELDSLKNKNRTLLSPFKNTPYLVYHDAYQYFETENNLLAAYFITSSTEHSPGIKRVKALRELIDNKNIKCIFYEPPNIPPLLNTLTESKTIKLAEIDPTGSQIPANKNHYFKLMQQTATTLSECLRY